MELRDIAGYEGSYGVTEDGRVWSYPKMWLSGFGRRCSHQGRFLTLFHHSGGYLSVALSRDGQTRLRFVHRLVAQAYIPNPQHLPEVNHIDANKKNNHRSNLEWNTRLQNAKHAKRHNLYKHEPARGERHPDAKLTDSKVKEIRRLWDADEVSLGDLIARYGLSKSSLSAVCNRRTWTHLP